MTYLCYTIDNFHGSTIAKKARSIISEVDQLHDIAKAAKGIIPTLAPYFLPYVMPVLNKSLPKLTIYLQENTTLTLITNLKEGKIDAGPLALPCTDLTIVTTELFSEEFKLAVPPKHYLSKRKVISQSELTKEKLLLLAEGHCLREQALDLCTRRLQESSILARC